jgi:nucleotide-binding universal stress UspA family protein
MASVTNNGHIILGTHGRKGLAHVILGSTAERIVQLAECPGQSPLRAPSRRAA